ncbi:MAG: mannose-1-phosphate guanylyltransferase/mannose-6-phosphate isomerase [Patescibacteria group bacterium]|jgi:mannose-1-phosphate guanylyltransferase/mannose-6-phosphate isomerase|nr:mannose-1-phosphate guanylyltransferase/mannose-6-phosphate isomerase [Patescibacteria group bacterium]
MYSVILCGGSGTRLWPLSRKNFPKQFLSLYSDNSLLQETFLRMTKIMPKENIFFVTNNDNFFNVLNQIKEIEKDFTEKQIIIEPASLNTAPAIALSVKYLLEKIRINQNAPIIFLPSDHYIGENEEYLSIVKKALSDVDDKIGTIGIKPLSPETGYGYIRKGNPINSYRKVVEFKEKPDKITANFYLQSGQYVWNAGMYIFNSKTFVNELKKHEPTIYKLLVSDYENFVKEFETLPSISIDFAISEKSDNVVVIEGDFGWSDIGSFDSLAELSLKNGNRKGKHISYDSKNIFTHSQTNKLITTIGVEDLVIIENNDSILIHKKGRGEDVKKIVDILKKENSTSLEDNLIVHRPWGKFEVLIDDKFHKVKRITVYPGEKLSLQSHYHRSEHWIVVKGIATIINNDKEIYLRENESTFITPTSKHRLENPGKINLEIIEVQTGSYLEEDDIIRYDDIYKRS